VHRGFRAPTLRPNPAVRLGKGGTLPIQALHHVRRMRGSAQAHLIRCDDGHFHVVKFQNNPQHVRVLGQ